MTNRNHLLKLLRELLASFDVPAHPDFEAQSLEPSIALSFQYNDLQLRLLHSEEPQIRHLGLIECRLGSVAPVDEESQYERLLDLNYRLCATNSAFAIDAEGGDILYTCAFRTDEMNLDALIGLIEAIEPICEQWLRTEGDATPHATPNLLEFLKP